MTEEFHEDRAEYIPFQDFVERLETFWEKGEIPEDIHALCTILHMRISQCMNSDTNNPMHMVKQSDSLWSIADRVRQLSQTYTEMSGAEIYHEARNVLYEKKQKERAIYSTGIQCGEVGTALSNDGTLCVGIALYAHCIAVTPQLLGTHIRKAGIMPKGDAVPVGGKRRVPIYDLAEVEHLTIVQSQLDPERLLDPCKRVVIRGEHIISDKAFSALHGIDLEVLKKEIQKKAVKATSHFHEMGITAYRVKDLAALPYVKKRSQLADITPETGEVTIGKIPYVHLESFCRSQMMKSDKVYFELGLWVPSSHYPIPWRYALLKGKVEEVIPRDVVENTEVYKKAKEIKQSHPLLRDDSTVTIDGEPCTSIDFFYDHYLKKYNLVSWNQLAQELNWKKSYGKLTIAGKACIVKCDNELSVVEVFRVEDLAAVVKTIEDEEAREIEEQLISPLEISQQLRDYHQISGIFRLSDEEV